MDSGRIARLEKGIAVFLKNFCPVFNKISQIFICGDISTERNQSNSTVQSDGMNSQGRQNGMRN
jgi:hypothetical protein